MCVCVCVCVCLTTSLLPGRLWRLPRNHSRSQLLRMQEEHHRSVHRERAKRSLVPWGGAAAGKSSGVNVNSGGSGGNGGVNGGVNGAVNGVVNEGVNGGPGHRRSRSSESSPFAGDAVSESALRTLVAAAEAGDIQVLPMNIYIYIYNYVCIYIYIYIYICIYMYT